MRLYKLIAIAFIAYVVSVSAVAAQSAIGKRTHLLHPSGIPAVVITNEAGTIANVDGRIVKRTEDTDLSAHEATVKELRWSGFQLQKSNTLARQ